MAQLLLRQTGKLNGGMACLQREQSWEELARLEALAASHQCADDNRDHDLSRSLRDAIDWYRRALARKERLNLE